MLNAFVGPALLLAACGNPQDPSPPRAPAAAPAEVRLFASSGTASVGTRISVSLGGTMADGSPLAGVEGWLRFAPAALRYVGTAEDSAATIAANDTGAVRGRVRVVAFRPGRLDPDAPVLAFDVLKADYLGTLTFETGAAVGLTGKLQRGGGTRRATVRSTLSAAVALRNANAPKHAMRRLVLPTIYGDADASGTVAQPDADLVGAWVVGNGAPPDTVTFNIANVAPQNLPGIGGPSDTLPPGWGAPFVWGGFVRQAALSDPPISFICERMLNLDDLLLISQEAGGTSVEVPGQIMPAGSIRPACADAASDTTRPAVPWEQMLPAGDSLIVVSPPAAPGVVAEEYFRTVFIVLFQPDAPGSTVREVLQRYNARIVGGLRDGAYVVEVPDPGASYAQYQAFLNGLKAEPSVRFALPYHSRPNVRTEGRYPGDGAGFGRGDWISGSSATWALRAVRAPLAWGCENGNYGAGLSVVAALEVMMPPDAHPDLASSVIGAPRYGTPQPTQAAMPLLARDSAQVHANAVMGHLTASTDNGQFAAGVIWNSRLVRFSNADTAGRPAIPVHMIQNVVSPVVQAEGIRILNISMEWYDTASTDVLEYVTQAFRTLLSANPDLILVKAMANNSLTAQASNPAGIKSMGAFNYALSILAREGFGDRIIFVAGTAPGNQWYSRSNFIHGLTDIAAPAEDVALLNLPGSATFAQFPHLHSGTSYAAPLVAGAIAQLLSFDPSLPTNQVKGYLRRGAQEPKQDPTTGTIPSAGDSTTWRVQGAGSRPVYQLDLYGSLTLLSRERQGTPLCGLEVVHRQNPANGIWSVTANRQAPDLLIANAPGGFDVLSVAQGGRRLVLGTNPYALVGAGWQALTPVTGIDQVVYTERDTVQLRRQSPDNFHSDLEVRINNGTWRNATQALRHGVFSNTYNPSAAVASASSVSPSGEHLVLQWDWADGFLDISCGPYSVGEGVYLVRLSNLQITPVSEYNGTEACSGSSGTGIQEISPVAAWRRDGTELLRAVTLTMPSYTLHRYRLDPFGQLSTGATVSGYVVTDMDWSPEGGRVSVRESTLGFPGAVPCQLVIRQVAFPHTPVEPALPINPEVCDWRPRVAPLRDGLVTALRAARETNAGTQVQRQLRRGAHPARRPTAYSVRAH